MVRVCVFVFTFGEYPWGHIVFVFTYWQRLGFVSSGIDTRRGMPCLSVHIANA